MLRTMLDVDSPADRIAAGSAAPERGLPPLALLAGMCGNLMEWYDFALYGVLAATLGRLFFPDGDRLLGLLSVFGVFAAGYGMRLVGGVIFGHVGDRLGRRPALLVSATTMAAATALVGCLPTFASVGILAPILFTVLRLLQGLSVGGEFTTSISYLVEHAPPGRRGLQGSLPSMTAGAGILLGSAVGNALFAIYPADAVLAWAWRIPFLLSVPLGLSLLLLRSTLPPEVLPPPGASRSPAGTEGAFESPVRTVLREHPGLVLRGIALGWGFNTCFYTLAVFLGSYLELERLLPTESALGLQTLSIALMVLLTPIAGMLADRVGRRAMVLASAAGCMLFVGPMLWILQGTDRSGDLAAEIVFASLIVAGLAPSQVWLAELFPRAIRSTGLGISYNAAAGILGGTTPLVCATLVEVTGHPLSPALWIGASALVSLLVALRLPDTSGRPLS